MPLPLNIPTMLGGQVVEWERLELKEGWNPESILHSICAFANDFHNLGGGYIVIGVAEKDGEAVLPPVGLESGALDKIQKEILHLGHHALLPPYHPLIELSEIDGKRILILWCPGGQRRPYKTKLSLAKETKE